MPEEVVRGRSLEEIRDEWAQKWGCAPGDLSVEVLDKPGFLSRQWKVRVSFDPASSGSGFPQGQTDSTLSDFNGTPTRVMSIDDRFEIIAGEGVGQVIPCRHGGELFVNGELQEKAFYPQPSDKIEYRPFREPGELTWELEVRFQGVAVAAKVKHKKSGKYILTLEIPPGTVLDLDANLQWQDLPPEGEIWDEGRLDTDLRDLKVVYGKRPECWSEILAVKGKGEVVVAEATLPIPPQPAQLEDFVGEPRPPQTNDEQKIDFFASKILLVKEGTVLARKIPAVPGVPGKDVYGRPLQVANPRDFQFRLKKNVHLSEDGREVIATCAGQPTRLDELTYNVENVYVLNQDVDLKTGSIEFPGDVFIHGNVEDGLHIFAGGKIEIQGAISRAEIRAEKGVKIYRNVIGGKIVVGEKFVVRSEILRLLSDVHEELSMCLAQTQELMKAAAAQHLKPGQILKQILERNFPELPKKAAHTENYLLTHKDELVGQDLMVSVRTAKHFLSGLGPLDLQAFPFLNRVNQAFAHFIENIALEVPEKLNCSVDYVQGATVESGGSFECSKGAYNSVIRSDGDVNIGVCRGGRVTSGGNMTIKELGGSEVSATFVQIYGRSHLKVNYCHPNVVIGVDKEIIRIEEAYRNLEIYRDKGVVQIEKLRVNPL